MNELPAIVVAGLGRCGTSLMMQMLHAGGVPCVGNWPDFETNASMFGRFDPKAFSALRGKAIKLITPADLPIGPMPRHIVIWLDRDPQEQARSQLKMLDGIGAPVANNRKSMRAFVAGLRHDRPLNMAAVGVGRLPNLRLSFERLITRPAHTVAALEAFLLSYGYDTVDGRAMQQQIRPRSAACYPGMMEFELLRFERQRSQPCRLGAL